VLFVEWTPEDAESDFAMILLVSPPTEGRVCGVAEGSVAEADADCAALPVTKGGLEETALKEPLLGLGGGSTEDLFAACFGSTSFASVCGGKNVFPGR
jgi:hypothetical protein